MVSLSRSLPGDYDGVALLGPDSNARRVALWIVAITMIPMSKAVLVPYVRPVGYGETGVSSAVLGGVANDVVLPVSVSE